MISNSRKFHEYFRRLYEATNGSLLVMKDFEEIFKDNETRMEYIVSLFDEFNKNNLSFNSRQIFEDTIDYIVDFINGNKKRGDIRVPNKYFLDESIGAIIPSVEDVEFLLFIIKLNKNVYEKFYKDNLLGLELPSGTFNQNMGRFLEIKDHNMAHLLGLTEHEDPLNQDSSKNILKKYILSEIKNKNVYGSTEAEIVLNWVTSKEGKNKLLEIHKTTLEFVIKDKLNNPNSYDENGNLKPYSNTISKFKERYKKETGLDYPIINFSRLITKSANTLNFLNLNNVVEMILDYNAPLGKTNEKDIFLVWGQPGKILNKDNRYIDKRSEILIDFYKYAFDQDNLELKQKLINEGIDVNKEEIKNQLNIIQAREFISDYGIEIDDSIIDEKIIEFLNKHFDREVHLLGFGTDFRGEEEISLDTMCTHASHCDTSIAITVPELIGHYYKRGRTFFFDKLESLKSFDKEYMYVSNVKDEINYLERVAEYKEEAYSRLETLKYLKDEMNERYEDYKKEFKNKR